MADAGDLVAVEGIDLRVDRLRAGLAMRHELGHHRIVEHRDLAAFADAVVDTDGHRARQPIPVRFERSREPFCRVRLRLARTRHERGGFRPRVANEPTGRRQEAAIRVFGIDAGLDRPAVETHIILRKTELFAIGDADHLLDEIEAGHHLGHRMLDLQPRVHLEEVEALARSDRCPKR